MHPPNALCTLQDGGFSALDELRQEELEDLLGATSGMIARVLRWLLRLALWRCLVAMLPLPL